MTVYAWVVFDKNGTNRRDGLLYSATSLEDLKLSAKAIAKAGDVLVWCAITREGNTGARSIKF